MHVVIGERNELPVERIRLCNIRSRLKVLAMNFFNNVGACNRKQIIISLEREFMVFEARSTKIFFRQDVLLDHSAHGTVQYHDTFFQDVFNFHSFCCLTLFQKEPCRMAAYLLPDLSGKGGSTKLLARLLRLHRALSLGLSG